LNGNSLNGTFHRAAHISDDTVTRARHTICQFAKDAPEARDFMLALGIYPGQDSDD
jgi:hypothetical protein